MGTKYVALFRFYEELNDFLSHDRKMREVAYLFNGSPAIKDSIEAIGVPHTEVDLIMVNGKSVGFDYRLQQGDRVAVYPTLVDIDISPIARLRHEPHQPISFVLDVHLGRLARWLRLLGFDVKYRNDYEDPEIIQIALNEHRIILTRDRRMLFNSRVAHACWIHAVLPEAQVQEVLRRLDLFNQIKPFYRCTVCNGIIKKVNKMDIIDQLEPGTIRYYEEFFQCPDCSRIYWKGTHYERMTHQIDQLIGKKR